MWNLHSQYKVLCIELPKERRQLVDDESVSVISFYSHLFIIVIIIIITTFTPSLFHSRLKNYFFHKLLASLTFSGGFCGF